MQHHSGSRRYEQQGQVLKQGIGCGFCFLARSASQCQEYEHEPHTDHGTGNGQAERADEDFADELKQQELGEGWKYGGAAFGESAPECITQQQLR